jgi:hypothetical protein
MTGNDLQTLIDFRSEVEEPDEETAKRIYALATASTTWRSRGAERLRRSGRSRLVLGVAAVAVVIVPTAIAFGGKLVDVFEGSPAPPEISTNFTALNRMADSAIQQGIASKMPHADVSKAHGVIEIQTPDGPQDLWAAPSDQGGNCYFIDFANDPPGPTGKNGFSGCDPSPPPASHINWGEVWGPAHPDLLTIWGTVFVDGATVRVTLDNGSTLNLPVVEGLFLGSLTGSEDSLSSGEKVEKVTAFDAAGNQVAEDSTNPK